MSEFLAWTEVQKEENVKPAFGGLEGIITFAAVILGIDAALFLVTQLTGWSPI